MRIATWNVNGLRARWEFLLHWLDARQPDLVGLQELKLEDDQFPHGELEAAGYHAVTHGQKAWNGVAILSREPLEAVQRGLPGQEPFGSRLLTARLGDLTFTTLYCPNGKNIGHDDFPAKLAWFDDLARHLPEHHDPDGRAVVCGDFNICPTGLDTWDEKGKRGKIFHTDEERARFRKVLDHGLVDLFRDLYPEDRTFSWWDYRGGSFHRGLGLRLDFLLGTRAVRESTAEVTIDREYRKKKDGLTASDHAPVMAEIE